MQPWCRQILQQYWVDGLFGSRHDGIPIADVELDGAARIAKPADQPHAQPAIPGILTD
jgi:hypothetical protein